MSYSIEERMRKGLILTRFIQSFIRFVPTQKLLKGAVANVHLPDDIRRETVIADNVSCEWIIPSRASSGSVLIYIHGGGFVVGMTPGHIKMAAYLARKMSIRVLMVDYRLVPEYPYPAALEDCITVFQWIVKQGISESNIAIGGDSAGGNLTLTTLMKLRDSNLPLPIGAVCLSPVVSLVPDSNTNEGMKDPILPHKAVEYYNRSYVGQNDPLNPLISPLFGSLQGFPPLLFHIGEDEILKGNAVQLAKIAKNAGVDVRYEIYPRMWHVWQLNLKLPQAIESLDAIANFLSLRLQKKTEE